MSGTIGVFVPRPGQKKTLEDYFSSNGVKYLSGLPVAEEVPDGFSLADVEEAGKDFVDMKFMDGTNLEIIEIDYLEKFEIAGVVVGWDIDYRIGERGEDGGMY